MPIRLPISVLFFAVALGCSVDAQPSSSGGSPAPDESTGGETSATEERDATPLTDLASPELSAVEFVSALRARAADDEPGSLVPLVQWEVFDLLESIDLEAHSTDEQRLSSASNLAEILRRAEWGVACSSELTLFEGPSGDYIARAPAMIDDQPETVAALDRLLPLLYAGVEVAATCHVRREVVEYDDEGYDEDYDDGEENAGPPGEPIVEIIEEDISLFALNLVKTEAGWRVQAWMEVRN